MALKLTKLTREERTKHVNICYYGASGTKKSIHSMTGLRNAIVIDIDHGLASVDNDDLSVAKIRVREGDASVTTDDFNDVIDFLHSDENKFDTVVFDIVTKYSIVLANRCREVFGDSWGLEYDALIRSKISELLQLEMNTILLFHEDTVALESGYLAKNPTIVGNKAMKALPNNFDIVIHAEPGEADGKEDFIGSWTAKGDVVAKNRFLGMIPDGVTHIGSESKVKNVQDLLDILTKGA
jgi:hypothetical protein